jgi:chromate transporter
VPTPSPALASTPAPALADFVRYFAWLGTTGFGGPIALCGAMQRDLVDGRKWVSKEDYAEGLALAQLAPGPLAAQLAMYLGWVKGGTFGATVVGVAFVLPSLLMVLALSAAYVSFGGLPWMQAAFYGVGAAVIGIIARSAHKLASSTVGQHKLLWGVFAASALYTAITESESLDAVAIAMLTPGPVVITVGFIGYLVAGPLGATVAALATFLPCWAFTVFPAPYFRKYWKNRQLKAFVDA